jgi:hypothetical protein
MKNMAKPVDALTVADLKAHPVWQFTGSDEPDEVHVRPLKRVPVGKFDGKLIGVEVTLANGQKAWAIVGNIDPARPRLTEHCLTISVERDGKWFHLARYHDFDAAVRGPKALAAFLQLPIDAVFPIAYDVQRFGKGNPAVLLGHIPKRPREPLTRSEIIDLIFKDK